MSAGRRADPLRPRVRSAYAEQAARAASVVPGERRHSCTPHSGLGCGSPTAIAALAPGEWVLDLGCGAGFDCLAAALEVGTRGRVVGVDMTPEMLRLAARHAADAGVPIVSFALAEIEALPFPAACFDVVISNCVVNLCADKARVFAEASRVLKPGGRLAVADIVARQAPPVDADSDPALRAACLAGATSIVELGPMLARAGFADLRIEIAGHSRALLESWAPDRKLAERVSAANITARKRTSGPQPQGAGRRT